MRKLLFSLFFVLLGILLLASLNTVYANTYNECESGASNACTAIGAVRGDITTVTNNNGSYSCKIIGQYRCADEYWGSCGSNGTDKCWSGLPGTKPSGVSDSQLSGLYTYGSGACGVQATWNPAIKSDAALYCVCGVPGAAPCAQSNPAPVGTLDGVDCNAGVASGWTCDASNYNQALEVDFYLDGGAGSGGTGLGSVSQASVSRPDLLTNGNPCGGTTNHGFSYQLPSSVYDGKQHSLYAYGINIPSDPSHNTLLTNSNMSFTCAPKTNQPTATPIPSATATPAPNHTLLNIALQLPGIGVNGNLSPKHTTRNLHISIYKSGDNPSQPNINPVFDSKNVTVTFNSNNGYFANPSVDVGTLPSGDYQILFKSPGYLRKEVVNPTDQTTTINITAGTTNQVPATTLIAGDIAPLYNVMDISDFYAIVACYKDKASSSTCTVGAQIADLNDDGVVDGIDVNYWLLGMSAATQANTTNPGNGDGVTGD